MALTEDRFKVLIQQEMSNGLSEGDAALAYKKFKASQAPVAPPIEPQAQQALAGEQVAPEPQGYWDQAVDFAKGVPDMLANAPAAIGEMITGSDTATERTDALDQWQNMPEMNNLMDVLTPFGEGAPAWKTAIGGMFASRAERAKIIKANYPDIQVETDDKGNTFYKSRNGKWYADKPGFGLTDIPSALGTAALAVGTATTGGLLPAALAAGGTEAVIEGTQAATGGDFNPENVALAGVLGPAGDLVGRGAGALTRKAGGALESMVTPQGAQQTMQQAMPEKLLDMRRINLRPPEKVSRIDGIRKMMGAGDEAGLAKAAQETPEAFQVATMKGALEPTTPQTIISTKPVAPKVEAPEVPTAGAQENLGALAQGATRSKKKKKAFAQFAAQNKEAIEAKTALKMDLPPDVTSDSTKFKATAMAPRLDDASEASAQWTKQLKDSSEQADKLLSEAGSGESGVDVSAGILDNMSRQKNKLKEESGKFIGEVDKLMPDETPVMFFSGKDAADKIVSSLDKRKITGELKTNLDILSEGENTYLTLRTIKEDIRNAKAKLPSSFAGLSKKNLDSLDEALKLDQIDNVSTRLGDEVGGALKEANIGYAKAADMEKTITKAFGSEETGSIGGKLKSALNSVGKDDRSMNELLKDIPDEHHAEMLMTGITENSRAKQAGARLEKGAFGFSEFADTYGNMKKNTKFMVKLAKKLGPERMKMLKDLDNISKRVTEVRAFQKRNGKDIAPMLKAMQSENFVAKIMQNPVVRGVTSLGTSMTPGTRLAVSAAQDKATDIVSTGGKKSMDAIGALFEDPVFLGFVNELAVKPVTEKSASKLAKSTKFLNFTKRAGIKNPTQFIMQAVRTTTEDEDK